MITFHYKGAAFKIEQTPFLNKIESLQYVPATCEDLYLPDESVVGKIVGTVSLLSPDMLVPAVPGNVSILFPKKTSPVFENVKRLHIPGYVSNLIADNAMFPNLEEIIIADDNQDLRSIGPMLIRGYELLYVFSAGMRERCIVPKDIQLLGAHAFYHTKCHEIIFEHPNISFYNSSFDDSLYLKDAPYRVINDTFFCGINPGRTLSIPDDVKHYNNASFRYCQSLIDELHAPFPLDKTLLGDLCFTTGILRKIKKYVIKNVKEFDIQMLEKFDMLESIEIQDTSGTSQFISVDGVVFSKDMKTLCFYPKNKPDQTYHIPEGTERIGSFWGNEKLHHLIMPSSVKCIDNQAFYQCKNLESIQFSENITEFPEKMCCECKSLKTFNMPSHLIKIGKLAFQDCPIKRLELPSSLEAIHAYAFQNCTELEELSFPTSLRQIGFGAFSDCVNLLSADVPNISYEGETFKGCAHLKTVIFSDELEIIPRSMFSNGSALEQIVLPKALKTIERHAFFKCDRLIKVTFPKKLQSIGIAAFDECALKSLSLPQSLREIGDRAFSNYGGPVRLPAKLSILRHQAFVGVSEVTIASSLTTPLFCAIYYPNGQRLTPLRFIIRHEKQKLQYHLSRSLDQSTILELNSIVLEHKFDQIEAVSFNGIQNKTEKYNFAIEHYKEEGANPVYRTYLRQVAVTKARWCIKNHSESELIDILELDVFTPQNLQTFLQLAMDAEMNIATAYILKWLGQTPRESSTLEL